MTAGNTVVFRENVKGRGIVLKRRCRICRDASNKQYLASPKGREMKRRKDLRHRAASPAHYEARVLLNAHIAMGKIKKGPCRVCGGTRIQAHHPDYNKPLEVLWLCHKHHMDTHYR
jgi:hypothetical protein